MEVDEFSLMLEALDMITAREKILELTVADYPSVKKESREKIHKAFHKQARPHIFEKKKPITTKELASLFGKKG